MLPLHPQFINDSAGQKLVVLQYNEFESLMEEIEMAEDVRLYDEAKREDDGWRISLEDYIKQREASGE